MYDLGKKLRNIVQLVLDSPQLLLREVLENPYKFMIFTCLLVVALGDFLPNRAREIPDIVFHLQVEVLIFLVFGVFVLAKKNETLLFAENDAGPFVLRLGRISITANHLSLFLLLLIFLAALFIRLWHLTALDPYTDENAHLQEAYGFLHGEGKPYSRARFVSGLVYLMWKIASPRSYNDYIFWSRVPSVVAGALTVLPLYLVAEKISRPVALISCLLWSLSPWAIGVSRYTREYAFYPLVILFVFFAYLSIVDHIKESGLKEIRKVIPHIVVVLLYFVGALVDYKSTLKVGIIILSAAALWHTCEYLLSRLSKGITTANRYLSYIVVIIGILAIVVVNFGSISGLGYQLHPRFLNAFLVSSTTQPTMWWSGYEIIERIPSFFIFVACIYFGLSRNKHYFAVFSVFLVLLFFYYMMFNRYFRPRYCYYILPFFTIVIAAGIFALFKLLKIFRIVAFRIVAGGILIVFLFSIFDYQNVRDSVSTVEKIKSNKRTRTGDFPATGEYHQYFKQTLRFLSKRVREGDVFITTVFQPVLMLGLNIPTDRIYYFPYKSVDAEDKVEEIVRAHDRGWIILDERRHGKKEHARYPRKQGKQFSIADKTVKMVLNKDEAQIYQWQPENKNEKKKE